MKLFGFELTWARAALEAVFPEGTALPHGIARMNPGRFMADAIASSPPEQSVGLRLTLWIVALAPLWLLRRPKTIASLRVDERQHVLERLIASPVYAIRQLAVAFKALASMLYAQAPQVRAAMTTPRARRPGFGLITIRRRRGGEALLAAGNAHEHAAE